MAHVPHKQFLKLWKLKPVAVADCVVVKDNKVLLIKRATPPFKGWWCLVGGLMEVGETIEKTAVREVKEETGITAKIVSFVGVYSGPKRDPRGTTLVATFLMRPVKFGGKQDGEISDMKFFPINRLPKKIGLDHGKMIKDALKVLRKNRKRK